MRVRTRPRGIVAGASTQQVRAAAALPAARSFARVAACFALRPHRTPAWAPQWSSGSAEQSWCEGRKAARARDAGNLAREQAGLLPLGRLAWRRHVWMRAHPSALGPRGRAFLARVHAGEEPYTFDAPPEA